jgi:hypothetical protein
VHEREGRVETLRNRALGDADRRGGSAGGGVTAAAAAGPAYGAGTTTRYVGAAAGSDKSCASPGYTSVQAAVNAASPGDTVFLCGTFKEQVIVTKSVTLTGSKGAGISAPATWAPSSDALPPQFTSDNLLKPQALIVAWGKGVHVTISGLTVAGPLPGNGGCAAEEFGILVIDGASAVISHDAVINIADANTGLYGCQFGIGIGIGHEHWPTPGFATTVTENFTGSAAITHTTVSGRSHVQRLDEHQDRRCRDPEPDLGFGRDQPRRLLHVAELRIPGRGAGPSREPRCDRLQPHLRRGLRQPSDLHHRAAVRHAPDRPEQGDRPDRVP